MSAIVHPSHAPANLPQLQRMTDASTVAIVEVSPDLSSDHCSEDGADDDRDRAMVIAAHLRTDGSTQHSADHRADLLTITAAFHHAVIAIPIPAGVTDIARIMFLTPAMRLGMVRRIGRRHASADKRHRDNGKQY